MFFHKGFDVTPEDAQLRMKQETLYLLDVRNLEEYQEGHLPHAHLIPLPDLSKRISEIPKDQPIYIYCRSGQRAGNAKKLLQSAGYQEVFNIGGVIQWPYPLEK